MKLELEVPLAEGEAHARNASMSSLVMKLELEVPLAGSWARYFENVEGHGRNKVIPLVTMLIYIGTQHTREKCQYELAGHETRA